MLSLTLGILPTFAPACAQAPTATALAGNPPMPELPAFLKAVPAGTVLIGVDADAFVQAACEAAFPFNPEIAPKAAKDTLIRFMRRSAAMLGQRPVNVPEFLLGKWPVKNGEYKVYVDRLRAAGEDVRPPFGWWRHGCKDDYEKHLPKIRKEFPKMENAALLYWERHGHELPYKVVDDKGNSIADHPVVDVTWRDANRFAASIGMRLPTEAEWTRAARGDGKNYWPLGNSQADAYKQELLNKLGMGKTTDYHTKPVGTIKEAVGPFGHLDMFGQVWQHIGELGYTPINGMPVFLDTWKDLGKHKIAKKLTDDPSFKKPLWRNDRAIAKGGSYLSYQEPIQLMIDARAPVETTDALEGLGFRLAKSSLPGFDYLYSLQRIAFDSSVFNYKEQELALASLSGGERYTIGEDGFPTGYDAAVFAPVNFLTDDKRMNGKKLLEESQVKPILIGALATSCKLANGTPAGMHAVYYRQKGLPKDVIASLKRGHKEVVKARKEAEKRAKKGGDDKEDDKDDDKKKSKKEKKQDKVTKWSIVAKKFGLTEDDLASPEAANGDCGYIRVNGVKVPTDTDAFLLAKGDQVVGAFAASKKPPTVGDAQASTMKIEAGENNKAFAKFRFGIPLLVNKPKKTVVFELHALLDLEAPSADKPWRLPEVK